MEVLRAPDLAAVGAYFRRLGQRRSPYWAGLGAYWPVLWTKSAVGHYSACRLLRVPFDRARMVKSLAGDLVRALRFTSPKLVVPGGDLSRIRNVVWSWVSVREVAKTGQGFDRYFGDFGAEERDTTLRIMTIAGSPTRADAEALTAVRVGAMFYERDWWRWPRILGLWVRASLKFRLPLWPPYAALSSDFIDGELIARQMFDMLKTRLPGAKAFILPYEGQPIQNRTLLEIQRTCAIETIGYVHSSPLNFPSFLVWKPGAPRLLLTHGRACTRVLQTFANWPEGSVKLIDSCRYKRLGAQGYVGKVFLPYSFSEPDKIVRAFEALVAAKPADAAELVDVRIHPDFLDDEKHVSLKRRIETVLSSVPRAGSSSQESAVFVGLTTAMLEALENGVKSYQVTESPRTDAFSDTIWPELTVERLSENCFAYQLNEPGAFIKFADDGERARILSELRRIRPDG